MNIIKMFITLHAVGFIFLFATAVYVPCYYMNKKKKRLTGDEISSALNFVINKFGPSLEGSRITAIKSITLRLMILVFSWPAMVMILSVQYVLACDRLFRKKQSA